MEEKPNVLEDLSVPRRRPWIFVVVAVVALLGIWMAWDGSEDAEESDVKTTVAAPAPVADGAAVVPTPAAGSRPVTPSPRPPTPSPVVAPPPAAPMGTGGVARAFVDLMAQAQDLEKSEAWVEARDVYRKAVESTSDAVARREVEARIGDLNIRMVMTPQPMPEKSYYVVKPGDSLDKIAKSFGTTVDLIVTNNLISRPNLIKAGDRLNVFSAKFAIVVNKTHNEMVVTADGLFFRRYLVGTGKYGRTPVGTFEIADKQMQPVWWRPDGKEIPYGNPENILGTRWMSLKATGSTVDVKGYGIHGTWDESTLGRAESAGCIRMRNRDVEELYTLLPYHTPVTIEE